MAKRFLTPLNLSPLTSDPAAGTEGDAYFNSSSNKIRVYYDGAWNDLAGGAGGGNSFETISTPSGTYPVADSSTDTLTVTANNGMIVTGTSSSDTVDFSTNATPLNTASTIVSRDSSQSFDITAIDFDTTDTIASAVGRLKWDDGEGTLSLGIKGGAVDLKVGQSNITLCYNGTGSIIPKGKVVYISGAQGQRPSISLSDADTEISSSKTFGVTSESILSGSEGYVTTFGIVDNIDTSLFTEGCVLWLSSTAGELTATMPTPPAHAVFVGYCLKVNAVSGRIFINPKNGFELNELHNVLINGIADNHIISYDSTTSLWKNQALVDAIKEVDGASSGIDSDLLDGQDGSYYLDWTNTTNKPDPTITLGGDLSGSLTLTDLAGGTLTASVSDDSHNHTVSTITNFAEDVQDIVGGMVSTNTESGISVTYDDTNGKLDFNVNDPSISLTGDVTGTATMTNLGNVSISTSNTDKGSSQNIFKNIVVSGQSNIVADSNDDSLTFVGGTGITLTTNATTDTLTVTNSGVASISGTTNQITASASTGSVTLSLPSAVTFPGTVTLNADPSQPLQAATKQYVDAVAQGLHIHASTQTATTANITSFISPPATIDGVTLTNNMRVLVKNQSTNSQNGIYVYSSSTGQLTRSLDFDGNGEIQGGDFVFVTGGTQNNDTGWVQTETVNTVGTDPIIFQQFSGAGTYTAGNGLTLTGSQFSINTGVTADLSTAQTLTNKTINGANNTLTVRLANDITGFGTGVSNFLATPTSANLATAVSDETGTGALVFATSPTLTTPNIGAATGTSLSLTGNISLGSTAQVGRLNTVDNYHAVILRGDTSDNSGTLVAQNTMAFVEFGGIWRFRQTTGTANTNVFEITTSAVTSISPFIAPAATTSIPSIRLPHGTAPTAPTNGDIWTTTLGVYSRINGTTELLADDATVVHLAGTETVTGEKTFGANLTMSSADILMGSTLGDRITLWGTHDTTGTYAIGIENSTQYFKSGGNIFRWYLGVNADGGTSDKMELNSTGLTINGSLIATTKSFDIEHPTKENMRLRYGSLEGPENGVYVRGKSDSSVITLPDYWTGLVDENSITVQLTPIGKKQNLFVKNISNNKVKIGGIKGKFEFFYFIQAERKDVERLVVEY